MEIAIIIIMHDALSSDRKKVLNKERNAAETAKNKNNNNITERNVLYSHRKILIKICLFVIIIIIIVCPLCNMLNSVCVDCVHTYQYVVQSRTAFDFF